MTDKTEPVEQDVDATAGGDQQEVSVEELRSMLAKAEADATKHRKIRQKVEQERDELKANSKSSQDEDYKALWQQEQTEKNKLLSEVKGGAIKNAVTAQLTKAGVRPEAIEAAAKLIDESLIEWELGVGVDGSSVTAAVAKHKGLYSFMYESKVAKTDPKTPVDGTSANASEIRKSDFYKLSPSERHAAVVEKGLKVVD